MPTLSKASLLRLQTCHPSLQEILLEAIKFVDFTVVCGNRGEAEQNQAYAIGKSQLKFPDSKHNHMPSLAVDIAPFAGGQIVWNDKELICNIAYFIKGIAAAKGINLRLGCDWNGNWKVSDEKFLDAFHLELA